MKKAYILIAIVSVIHFQAFTQAPTVTDTLEEDEPILDLLDTFLMDYNFDFRDSAEDDSLSFRSGEIAFANRIPRFSPEVIAKRIEEIPSEVPLTYNSYVQRYIDVYTIEKRDQVERMLGLQQTYFPIFEEALDRTGMPMEIKYLSVVESALNPHARSRVGATGLWQFMYYTARYYGLEVNTYLDERKDPFKSTDAAIRYLQLAYNRFGDWLLAIAAYNCGEGNVRKAIRRSGGKKDFWAIRNYLPRETRGYVPAFIAAMYTFYYAEEHNLYPIQVDLDYYQDTLHLSHIDISLQEIARITRTDVDDLVNLNPHLKLGKIPYSAEPFVLRVPKEVGLYFAKEELNIRRMYGKKRETSATLASQKYDVDRPQPVSQAVSYPKPPGTVLVYYTVRSGDVVGTIAEKYQVSSRDIARWNGLRRYRIRVGQKLKIYTKKSVAEQKARPASVSNSKPVQQASAKGIIAPQNAQYYRVKSGDTLWDIAQEYTRGDVDALLSLNSGLRASSRLRIGQSIRVK